MHSRSRYVFIAVAHVVQKPALNAALLQRRVRHLTEVLVRNLSIPAAFVNSDTSGSSSLRPLYGRSAFSSSGATAASSVAGPSSGSSLTERFPTYAPPGRSKDDLDLYIPALHRRRSGRRKLTVSHGAKTPSSTSDGTAKDIDQPSGNGVPAGRRLDVKGKGRESSLASSRETLNSIQESETSDAARPIVERELEVDDSDVVFGWTSASRQPVPLHLERSKSKSSLKSSSSKRSISSSVSKRFFKQNRRRRSSLIGSEDEDDDEDSEGSQAHSPRRTTSSKDERPASPMSPHVSFQMASDHGHAWSSGIDFASDLPNSVSAASRRARSASRGSVFSVASGSSASTIRASAAFKHSEKEERFLRWKRYEDIRAHLVRSRLVLCIPQTLSMDTENLDTSLRPPMTRTRTISLPLRSNSGRDTVRSSPSNSGKRTPFYISEPHKKSMEPSFPLEFSTADSSSVESSNASKCHRIIVQIWIESPDNSPFENQGKNDTGWNLLLEWDVDLRRLISLGTDVRLCLLCCYQTRLIPNS